MQQHSPLPSRLFAGSAEGVDVQTSKQDEEDYCYHQVEHHQKDKMAPLCNCTLQLPPTVEPPEATNTQTDVENFCDSGSSSYKARHS